MVAIPSLARKVLANLGTSPVGGTQPGEIWYDGSREHVRFNSGSTFGDMDLATALDIYNMVQSTAIHQIITSTDPNTPLLDGQLLLVYDDGYSRYFEDWANFPVNTAPAGWTGRWLTSTAWQVVADGSAGVTNGKVLRLNAGSGRRGLSWDKLDTDTARADVEIVFKHRVAGSSGSGWPSAMFRASGAAGSETGYVAGIGYASAGGQAFTNISRFSAGANLEHHTNTTLPTGNWYITRVRAIGSSIQARTWLYNTTEPTTWDNTEPVANSDILSAGWVGLWSHGVATEIKDFDWISVCTGGGSAPMGT